MRFGSIEQGSQPICKFYNEVRNGAQVLIFTPEVITNQFFCGLNRNNLVKAERIGADTPVSRVIRKS